MLTRFGLLLWLPLLCGLGLPAAAEPDNDAEFAAARAAALKTYKDQVAPFIATYCTRCHGEKKKKGGVTFEYAVKTPGSSAFRTLWKHAVAN
ncbi:MAG TPA: hypothetical protein VM222_05715, partial [Planctomycetota bacterium]|nr:hypothetical protein [Planctomycetota bacterium]